MITKYLLKLWLLELIDQTLFKDKETTSTRKSLTNLELEVSGYIEKIGKNVKIFLNNKVAALVNGGGYAEFCLAEQESTFKIQEICHLTKQHVFQKCYFTAWSNLVQE